MYSSSTKYVECTSHVDYKSLPAGFSGNMWPQKTVPLKEEKEINAFANTVNARVRRRQGVLIRGRLFNFSRMVA